MEYCFRYYLNKVEVSLYIIEWTNIFTINIEYWMSLFHTTYTFILNKDKILEKNSPLPATRIWVQLACYIRQHYTLLTFILQIFNCSIKHRAGFWFPSVCFLILRFFFFLQTRPWLFLSRKQIKFIERWRLDDLLIGTVTSLFFFFQSPIPISS